MFKNKEKAPKVAPKEKTKEEKEGKIFEGYDPTTGSPIYRQK